MLPACYELYKARVYAFQGLRRKRFFTIKDTFPFIGKVQNFLYGFPLRQAAEKVAAPGL